jgi:hypothetical protein
MQNEDNRDMEVPLCFLRQWGARKEGKWPQQATENTYTMPKKAELEHMQIFFVFSHPDYTVGSGITPDQLQNAGRGLYRRWGIGNAMLMIFPHPPPKTY